jgi:hypothetical protein
MLKLFVPDIKSYIMPVFQYLKAATYAGHGGPAKKVMDKYNIPKTPTSPGRFVIASISPHVSYEKYADWSCVPWGTPVRLNNNIVQVNYKGGWMNLSKVNTNWASRPEADIKDYVENQYKVYYGIKKVPDTWVFSDFGHTAIKYFKDIDGDYKYNPATEQILGDFIHTTPGNEASTARNLPFGLSESHGCIHTKPADLDEMIARKYLALGQVVEVHPYTEIMFELSFQRNIGKGPYEFHFYPGVTRGRYKDKAHTPALGQIVIYSVTEIK